MRTIWLVAKHDVATTLRQRSFWFLALLMPLLLMGLQAFTVIQDSGGRLGGAGAASAGAAEGIQSQTIGLVDPAGLIATLPEGIPADKFVSFPDAAAARAALEENRITQYLILPAEYATTGQVTVFDRDFRLLSSGDQPGVGFNQSNTWMLDYIINANLTGDSQLALALHNPTPTSPANMHALAPADDTDAIDEAMAALVAQTLPFAFYFLLMMASSYLMRSVVAEKENRTAEVLLVSLEPRRLMVGKILAMTVVMLIQLVIWVGGGVLILNVGADLLNIAHHQFPPGFALWAGAFLLLGYLLYASVMAAAGAIAPSAREGNQVTAILIIPLMPTLMFARILVQEPESPLTLVLSLLPFSSPSAMVTRLAVGGVPLWQLLVSAALLASTTYLFVTLAGRFFRAGNLLSGASFTWRRLVRGWRQ